MIFFLSFTTSGCWSSSDIKIFIKHYEYHGNENYLEYDEIYKQYLYVKSAIENTGKWTKEEIITLCNAYKMVTASIEYIDLENPGYHVVDAVPELKGLHTDLKKDIVALLVDYQVLVMPEEAMEYQVGFLSEYYLIYTEYLKMEEIIVVQDFHSPMYYYVLSKEGDFIFYFILVGGIDDTLYFSPNNEYGIKNFQEIVTQGIFITETDKKIPTVKLEK